MFKSKTPEKTRDTAPATAEVTELVKPERPAVAPAAPAAARAEPTTNAASCIGSGMSIVGTIECNGPAQVFGRIEGELRASDLLIGTGAEVEGSIIAEEVTICGRVKGTIRALRVRLQGGGVVEGDIFHKSLSIDESSLFEGSSRRMENPTDQPASGALNGSQKRAVQAPPPLASIEGGAA